eukprot:SM000311S11931  [mRNA]  locus=s311:106610:112559:- [translate_table: standard]
MAQRERRSSHGASGPANPFHEHRGRVLEEDDLLALAAGRTKFATTMPAAGIPRGKWVTDQSSMPEMNHLLKTRDEVTKNNEKKLLEEEGTQDQGFTRPKDHEDEDDPLRPQVLILLPFRSLALKVIERFIEVAPPSQKTTVEEKDRFFDDFGVEEAEEGEAVSKKALPSEAVAEHDRGDEDGAASLMLGRKKPLDHTALFSGNNDDHFRIGIKLTRRSIKLYTDFYNSDIIVASPIGLITRIGEASSEKDKDVDFLSSIEILVVGYADVILMQNWSHVVAVVESLNQLPQRQHGTDLMRVREWFILVFEIHYRYTKQSDISRSRSWFFHGKRSIMLYTERAHFYHRYRLRGIQELIFYSLPDNAHFYAELLNLLEGAANPRCTVLFTKFDKLQTRLGTTGSEPRLAPVDALPPRLLRHQVERIVGSTRASRLLHSENRTLMFC